MLSSSCCFNGLSSSEVFTVAVLYAHLEGSMDFPGGSVVKNPFASAGDMGLTPGKTWNDPTCHGATCSEYSQLLSLGIATTEPVLQLLKPEYPQAPWSPCSPARETTTMRRPCTTSKEGPPLVATRKKPTQQQRPSMAPK